MADAAKEVKKIGEEQKKLLDTIKKTTQSYEGLKKAMLDYSNITTRSIGEIIQQTARLNVDTQKIAQANKEGFEYIVKRNQKEIEANDKQIEALSKNIKKQKELMTAYEKRAELIVEEAEISKAKIEKEYRLLDESLAKNEDYDIRMLQLTDERNQKILAIEKETQKKISQNAVDMQMDLETKSKATIDQIVAHAGEVVKHTSGVLKGVISVGAQKEHLDTVKGQYQDYLTQLKEFGIKRMTEYNKQIGDHRLSADENNKLIADRNAFSAGHNKLLAEETKRIGKEIETVEKNSQNLRLQQWQTYAANAEKLTKKVSEATQIVTSAASNIFKQKAAGYKAEADAIDQDIKDNETAKYEELQIFEEKNKERERQIAEETEKMNQDQTEDERKTSQEKIDILQSEMQTKDSVTAEYKEKDEKLKNDKRKVEAKQKKAEKVQKKIDLGQQMVTATADIAAGIAKSLALGPFIGPIMAAMVGAMGAVQLGVMAKQFEQLEDGGLLHGKRHRQGGMRIEGTNIEVEGGEYVVNRQSTGKNLGLLRYINSQRRELDGDDLHNYFARPFTASAFSQPFSQMMEQGGQVPALPTQVDISNQDLLHSIQDIKFEPRVAVTDIHTVQGQIAQVDEWVGM